MTARELERKLTGGCTRCGEPAGDTNLCEPHRLALNTRVSRSKRTKRSRTRLLPVFATTAIAG